MGLCARFGWLPSAALDEDWALLAELQARLQANDKEAEYAQWQARVKSEWQNNSP